MLKYSLCWFAMVTKNTFVDVANLLVKDFLLKAPSVETVLTRVI